MQALNSFEITFVLWWIFMKPLKFRNFFPCIKCPSKVLFHGDLPCKRARSFIWPKAVLCQVWLKWALCSGKNIFWIDMGLPYLAHASITMRGWYSVSHTFVISIWPWLLTSISKLYFHQEFESGKIVYAHWHKHTKFRHMGISPWVNMLSTFLTFVWPWPLSSTHSFFLEICSKIF